MRIKSIFAVLSLSLILGISAMTSITMAAPPPPKQHQSTVLEEYKKPPSFLFVLQANEATMAPVKGKVNLYTLTMKLTDDNVGNIIDFSDRPYRIVTYMTVKQLQQLWGEGKNSFKTDPPNAVLSAEGVDASIVIIEGYEISEGQLVLMLVVEARSNMSRAAALPQLRTVEREVYRAIALVIDERGVNEPREE